MCETKNISKEKIISLLGPTGIGKSSLAIKLKNKYPIEIVSVDSVMIYRDMNIGTDKPSDEILSSIKKLVEANVIQAKAIMSVNFIKT